MKKILTTVAVLLVLSSSSVMAQDVCKGDYNYDGSVDVSDTALYLGDLGRNPYSVNPEKPPCPPNGPAPVEKTGQTTSYGIGDDGDLEKGIPWPNPRFTDNLNGTVTDNLT